MAMVKRRLGRNESLLAELADSSNKPENVLDKARSQGISTEPLDITRLVGNLGIQLRYEDMSEDISGHLQKREDIWVISVNQNHHEKRRRFTIAHELGHFFLHGNNQSDFWDETTVLFRNNVDSNSMEWQANRFAAELLMPEDAFREKVRNGMTSIESLADHFNVSALSVRIRAKQLGFQGHGV